MTSTPAIACGGYVLTMTCPNCRGSADVFVILDTRLTVEKDGGTLRPSFHSTGVDHRCSQPSMADLPAEDEVGTRPFDFAERAAGEHLDRDDDDELPAAELLAARRPRTRK